MISFLKNTQILRKEGTFLLVALIVVGWKFLLYAFHEVQFFNIEVKVKFQLTPVDLMCNEIIIHSANF